MEQEKTKAKQDQLGVGRERVLEEIRELQESVASLPDRDKRTPEEIIGFDEFGIPG
jgi:hypothetical protein